MFFLYIALPVYIAALLAAFNMDSIIKGVLFMVAVATASGLLYLFINHPLESALGVILIMAFFLLKLKR